MENHQLQKWALIAEIFGGVAVIITLVLLVTEVRNNSRLIQADTYDRIAADMAQWRMDYARIDALVELNYLDLEDMSPRQILRARDRLVTQFLIFERAYIQWDMGNMEDRGWERFKRTICLRSNNSAFEERWGRDIDAATTEDFAEYRKTQC